MTGARGVDPSFVAGAILVSGVHEPQIAMQTSVNADLHLDEAMAARCDVLRKPAYASSRVAILVGAREPWRWIDQSFRHALHLHRQGREVDTRVVPNYGHFDIIRHYLDGGPILDLPLEFARG
jgi:arylformamidase